MPILKPISGHCSTGGIRRYLEKVAAPWRATCST